MTFERAICPFCSNETIPITIEYEDKSGVLCGWTCNCESIDKLETERENGFLIQIHHQFENGTTDMCVQFKVNQGNINKRIKSEMEKLKETHPLPFDAKWMLCEEGSDFFVVTKK